jgi:hypothetical protein
MPRFDGTGPAGMGPMTGRGMGYCVVPLPSSRNDNTIGDPEMYGNQFVGRHPITSFVPYRGRQIAINPVRGRFGLGRHGRGRRFW